MRKLFFITAIVFASSPLFAQSRKDTLEEMHIDMPDETEETEIVDKGKLQLETGVLYQSYKDSSHSIIGQGLLRYGLTDKVELRLLVEDGKNRDTYIEQTVQSTSPLAIGTKIELLKDQKVLPDITLVSYLKLPFTSHSSEQKSYWSPIFIMAFKNKGGEKFQLEYNVGLQQEAFSPDWLWMANTSVHYKLTDAFEIFGEYYAQYKAGEDPIHNLGAGATYQLNNMVEVYLVGGTTIVYKDYSRFASGGVAFRLN